MIGIADDGAFNRTKVPVWRDGYGKETSNRVSGFPSNAGGPGQEPLAVEILKMQ